MSHQRVVITGIGALTAIGSGQGGLWRGILRGESGIRRLTRFDASSFESQIAGEVDDFDALAYFPARRVKRLDPSRSSLWSRQRWRSKIRNRAVCLFAPAN